MNSDDVLKTIKENLPIKRCQGCNVIIYKGIVEKGIVYVKCHNCNNDNVFYSNGNVKEKVLKKGINPIANFVKDLKVG